MAAISRLIFIALLAIVALPVTAAPEWTIETPEKIEFNKATTITLARHPAQEATTNTLWLGTNNRDQVLLPETVLARDSRVSVPIFVRSGANAAQLLVIDPDSDQVSSISLPMSPASSKVERPGFSLTGHPYLPVVFANQDATATLALNASSDEIGGSAHISVMDHRGKMVVSKFFDVDEITKGKATLRVPAAGYYAAVCKVLKEPMTSMPTALWRDPIPVPFGKLAANLEDPFQYSDAVTTDTVIGTRITLEHIPTSATVVGEDRFNFSVLAEQSSEIRKNRWPFGVAGIDMRNMTGPQRDEVTSKYLEMMKILGATFAPVQVEWKDFQTGINSFRWFLLNDILPRYRSASIRPLLSITGRSAWNDQLPTETTTTIAAWTYGMREISRRYQPLLWGLQCWTDTDDNFSTSPGKTNYIDLVQATWEGFLNRESGVLRGPPIIIGGSQKFNKQFLDDVLTTVTVPKAGGLAFDLYPDAPSASPEENGFPAIFAEARKLLRNNRASHLGLWLTGTGWATGPDGVTEKVQANYLVRTYVAAIAAGFNKVFWGSLVDKADLPWTRSMAERSGLLRANLSPKPSAVAYNLTTFIMGGVTSGTLSTQGNAQIYKFHIPVQNNKWPGLLYVAWTGSPKKTEEVHLDMRMGGGVYVFDYLGAEIPASNIDENSDNPLLGTYRVPVGFEPVFIWDAGKPGNIN